MSEGSTNSDFDLVQIVDTNDFHIQTKLDNLLIEFNEEKEKNVKLEEKNNYLEKQMNEMNGRMGELAIKFEHLTKNCKRACFVQIKNEWVEATDDCCANKCLEEIDTENTKCVKGNGFVKLLDDENIKYINCEGKGRNKYACVFAENNFDKPEEDCTNYSFFYFEIKGKKEGKINGYNNWLSISLENDNEDSISLVAEDGVIENEEEEVFRLDGFCWKDGDIFGCGLVYPPTEKMPEKLPYIFFTQNGKQIGKAVLLKENFDSYEPTVRTRCCSVEANFGNDLEAKPFCYDITKHFVIKEFYEDSDVD
uniref:Uncharacterized protein n=2 Tax=Meloidogyne TaxID=189290 RepID=A0A6V7TLJ4_MELEN|nr:unnamed protein product [Meloidogyne enterolobii]